MRRNVTASLNSCISLGLVQVVGVAGLYGTWIWRLKGLVIMGGKFVRIDYKDTAMRAIS
jgi:hypothetical protein